MCGDEGVETRGEGLHVFVSGRRRHRAAGIAIPYSTRTTRPDSGDGV